jgi:hypothetical protein
MTINFLDSPPHSQHMRRGSAALDAILTAPGGKLFDFQVFFLTLAV